MGIDVVICTYSRTRAAGLRRCVAAALAGLPEGGGVMIVVDADADAHADADLDVDIEIGAATDPGGRGLARELAEAHAGERRVRVLRNARTWGLSGARNTAIEASGAEILLFIDDDAVLRPGWAAAIAEGMAGRGVAILAGAVIPDWEAGGAPAWFPPEYGWVVGCDYAGLPPSPARVRNPIGACMAIRRGVFARVGMFAEGLGRIGAHPVGGEETDLGMRLAAERTPGVPREVIRDARLAVDHAVPRARARPGYFLRRCFWEGRSKALLAARAGTLAALDAERAHATGILARASAADLARFARGDRAAAARVLARAAGLSAAALGLATASRAGHRRAVLDGSPRPGLGASVAIASLGRSPSLAASVRAALAQEGIALEVLVVDNDPRSGRVRAALAGVHDARLRIVEEPRRGLSLARNRAIACAGAPLIAFTDDDALPEPGWLAALAAALRDATCATGRVRPASLAGDAERWFEGAAGFDRGAARLEWGRPGGAAPGWAAGPRGPVYPIAAGEFGSGNSMAFRRGFLVERGGFARTLGAGALTRGGEDLDMFRRVILSGGILRYEPAARVRHRHRDGVPALRRQLFGYGTGMAANVTRLAARSPRRALAVARALPAGLRLLLRGDSAKNRERPADFPRGLVWAERAGYALGPLLYLAEAARTGLGLRGAGRGGRG